MPFEVMMNETGIWFSVRPEKSRRSLPYPQYAYADIGKQVGRFPKERHACFEGQRQFIIEDVLISQEGPGTWPEIGRSIVTAFAWKVAYFGADEESAIGSSRFPVHWIQFQIISDHQVISRIEHVYIIQPWARRQERASPESPFKLSMRGYGLEFMLVDVREKPSFEDSSCFGLARCRVGKNDKECDEIKVEFFHVFRVYPTILTV